MTPERWKTIEDIFQAAVDCAPAERQKFIEEKCAGDVEIRAQVEKLVARHETDETFLESPVWTDSFLLQPSLKHHIASSLEDDILPASKSESLIGKKIGVYRLIEEIGKGGMGMVYLAERADGEFQQKAAIKLIKRGMDTDFIIKRFRHERQILATLNHPNIARLLDGGTTPNDLPYFIMEYVEGEPINKYCERKRFNLRQKLELFLAVCAAVSYAHKRKIVHRDIKPSNILVNEDNVPKLLDFGIAKILDPDLIHESVAPTATQMRLMTPEYASPEQVRGEKITPASDQYSLGVLFYELITGNRPYKFPSRAPHEIARVICEEEPSEPSSGGYGNLLHNDVSLPDTDDISRKLDLIVLKTLRKDPLERYPSVADLASDIESFLRNEAIQAKPFTNFGKLIERLPLTNQKSIAVLPFRILTPVEDAVTGGNEFLGIGLADAIITRLSTLREIIVRPTSSVLRFNQAATINSFEIGSELNVRYVLEGSILYAAKRIRISVQLLDTITESTVWAERFDEDFTDVLSLEDLISRKVANLLEPHLTTDEIKKLSKHGTDNVEAYEAYLRGRFHWNTFTEEGLGQAIKYYRQALELDPNYALAYAAVADYYNWLGMYGILSFDEFYLPAKEAALRAIEIDEKLPEAYAALSLTRLYGEYDWAGGEREILRALELNPNSAITHLWYSHNLCTQNRVKEALFHVKRSIDLDPSSFQNHNTFVWGLYFDRRIDEALAETENLIEKFPASGVSFFSKACFLSFKGRGAEAVRAAEMALELSSDGLFFYGQAQALASAGRNSESREIISNALSSSGKQHISYYHIAVIYCFLKDKEKAFEFLERSFAVHEGMLIWTKVEPSLDILRADPRYHNLLERINPAAAPAKITGQSVTASDTSAMSAAIPTGHTQTKNKRKRVYLVYAGAAILLVIIGLLAYNFFSHLTHTLNDTAQGESWRNTFASTMRASRVTTSGEARQAVVSPDGQQIAYIFDDFEQQSLRMRQTNSENDRQITAPQPIYYIDFKFSPDNKFLYYLIADKNGNSLYRILTTGGTAEKVFGNIADFFAFSPDGQKMAYDNFDSDGKHRDLVLCDLDESLNIKSSQTILQVDLPNFFSGIFSFSPDGTKIVYAASVLDEGKEVMNLFVYDLQTAIRTRLGTTDFRDVAATAWRNNGKDIIICASENTSAAEQQLWLVSYPSGEVSRLTNDFDSYFGVSLSADSSILITSKNRVSANLWTAELAESNQDPQTGLKQITSGIDRQDGINGVNWTKSGQILYIASVGTAHTINLLNEDGTNNQIIPTQAVNPSYPSMTTDNHDLIYADEKGETTIWKFDMTTQTASQLVSNYAVTPAIAPDSHSIVYASLISQSTNKLSIHRKPLDQESKETAMTPEMSVRPVVSPNGQFIACNFISPETNDIWQLAILPVQSSSGASPILKKVYADNYFRSPQSRPLAWSPDNRYIYYLNNKGSLANIYRVAAAGSEAPVQVTHFTSGQIFDFALSPDGKRAILSRGSNSSDVVIFRNTQ